MIFDDNKPKNWYNDYCSCCKSTKLKMHGCGGADCYVSICSACIDKWGVFVEERGVHVCPACANGTAPFTDKFIANSKNTDENKIKIRRDFSNEIRGQASKVLMLDCGEATQHLKKSVSSKLEIHVPNPDPVICKKLKRFKAKAYQMRLSHMLTLNKIKFDAAWLDYCGVYDGSNVKGYYPREDLRKMWERCLNRQRKTVHLAVTFCKRGCHTGMKNMINEQKQTAKMWGWKAVPTKQVEYGKGMYYVMFKATKI